MAGHLSHFTVQSIDEHGNHRNRGDGNDTFAVILQTAASSSQYIDSVVQTLGAFHGASADTAGSGDVENVTKVHGHCNDYIGTWGVGLGLGWVGCSEVY
jgi:hypothetical protein